MLFLVADVMTLLVTNQACGHKLRERLLISTSEPLQIKFKWADVIYIAYSNVLNCNEQAFILTYHIYTLNSVMLPAQHPDLNGVSVLRQYVAEERLGTPVFVGRVGSRHAVFTQGNLGQQHPGEAIIVNNLVHWNLDFEVWAAWCQSCPWASTNQLDRQKEAEMEIRPVGVF